MIISVIFVSLLGISTVAPMFGWISRLFYNIPDVFYPDSILWGTLLRLAVLALIILCGALHITAWTSRAVKNCVLLLVFSGIYLLVCLSAAFTRFSSFHMPAAAGLAAWIVWLVLPVYHIVHAVVLLADPFRAVHPLRVLGTLLAYTAGYGYLLYLCAAQAEETGLMDIGMGILLLLCGILGQILTRKETVPLLMIYGAAYLFSLLCFLLPLFQDPGAFRIWAQPGFWGMIVCLLSAGGIFAKKEDLLSAARKEKGLQEMQTTAAHGISHRWYTEQQLRKALADADVQKKVQTNTPPTGSRPFLYPNSLSQIHDLLAGPKSVEDILWYMNTIRIGIEEQVKRDNGGNEKKSTSAFAYHVLHVADDFFVHGDFVSHEKTMRVLKEFSDPTAAQWVECLEQSGYENIIIHIDEKTQ